MTPAEVALAVMLQLSPPGRAVAPPGFEETPEERAERYAEIARDVVEIVGEEGSVPGYSRAETISLVVAIAYHESGFAHDVDRGECFRGDDPKRCDSGRAVCILQVHEFAGATAEALKGRRTCIRAGLFKLRASVAMCRKNAPADRFAGYASGSCDRGLEGSRSLFGMWRRAHGLAKYELSKAERAKRKAARDSAPART